MKIIYSFDTDGGRIIPGNFYKKMAELSVLSAKKLGYPVELYADLHGIEFFSFLPWDSVVIVEPEKYRHSRQYWNFVKLLTYSLQNEPFLHVDFDTYFHPGFTIPDHGDILTEMERDYSYVRAFSEVAVVKTDLIPEKLICSGLLGGYDTTIWKELFSWAVYKCQGNVPEDKAMSYLVGVEEFNISQLALFYGLEVVPLDHQRFDHFQGCDKEKRFGDLINSLHKIIKTDDYEKSIQKVQG